ncbi:MAG TPA: hypothetical protein VLF90_00065 [Patescibacteria group bacterium]|nr:hypothetical protein [Patescibacteria group bacterium]
MIQPVSPYSLKEVVYYDAVEKKTIELGGYIPWELADIDRCVREVEEGSAGLIFSSNIDTPMRVIPLGITGTIALTPEGSMLRSEIPHKTRFARLPNALVDHMLNMLEEAELLEHTELDQAARDNLRASPSDTLYGLGRIGLHRAALLRPLLEIPETQRLRQSVKRTKGRLEARVYPLGKGIF